MTAPSSSSAGLTAKDHFDVCAFCPTEKKDLYKCPRCEKFYCSLRCYKSPKHLACSEEFYKRQCMEADAADRTEKTETTTSQGETTSSPATTFEEYMESSCNNASKARKTIEDEEANPQIEVGRNEEIVFDSDDEPEYLADVIAKTVNDFEKMDADELDRRMLVAGLPGLGSSTAADEEHTQRQMDALYATLTDDEKRAFKRLADEIVHEEMGLTQSCFAPNKTKNKGSKKQ